MSKTWLVLLLLISLLLGVEGHSWAAVLGVLTEDFTQLGTWIVDGNASGAFGNVCLRGLSAKGNTIPAVAEVEVPVAGTYRVWVRSRDFATSPGTRYFQIAINGQVLDTVFGQHGVNGWAWDDAGTILLEAGTTRIEALDTSNYFARLDTIYLTTDLNSRPPDTFEELLAELPTRSRFARELAFPAWATATDPAVEVAVLENDDLRVKFFSLTTDQGPVIQQEIWVQEAGTWRQVKGREDEYGYLLLYAEEGVIVSYLSQYPLWQQTFTLQGKPVTVTTANAYEAGLPSWLIPDALEVLDAETIRLVAENDYASLVILWQLSSGAKLPQVTCRLTPKRAGQFSLGIFSYREVPQDQVNYVLNPYRINSMRIPEEPYLVTEQFSSGALSLMTVPAEYASAGQETVYGVVVDPESIPYRWVYPEDSQWGLGTRGPFGGVRPALFAPLLGQEVARLKPGDAYEIKYRPIYVLGDWYAAYKHIVEEVFQVTDYRKNYYASLTEAGFNIHKLILDDQYGGWDPYMKAHYNMEGRNVVSQANALVHLQSYLLTEDPDVLSRRAIPTLVYLLTRSGLHFAGEGLHNRGTAGGLRFSEPHGIGQPTEAFGTDVFGGAYLMTRGLVPVLRQIGLDRGVKSRSAGFVPSWAQYLWMYNYTGTEWYLDVAKRGADAFLTSEIYGAKSGDPGDVFINISYLPYWTALLDLYEACGEEKYLAGAAEGARRLLATLWIQPRIPAGEMTVSFDFDQLIQEDFWWAGDYQQRVGFAADAETMLVPIEPETVPAWVPARIGLGVEQPGTFRGGAKSAMSKNITATHWAPDLLRLAKYTGDELFEVFARNAVIGRFANYPGYYYNQFTVHQMKPDYPYVGPDTTNIYYHHIPTYLALVQDFLVTQAWSWSDGKISFPAVRQQGYAWFANKHYGFAPGQFFDEDEMWLWLKEGLIYVDNIQIDWVGARKEGKAAFALMNEDVVAITTTITLGEELTKGAVLNGQAKLYDATGQVSYVPVHDNQLTVEVPAHGLVGVVLDVPGVQLPAYAQVPLEELWLQPVGTTVAEAASFFDFGRGIVLQMDPNVYYAYVYVVNMPSATREVILHWRVGDGQWQKTHSVVYPYEFLIPVEDTDQIFEYHVEIVDQAGNTRTSSTKQLKPLL